MCIIYDAIIRLQITTFDLERARAGATMLTSRQPLVRKNTHTASLERGGLRLGARTRTRAARSDSSAPAPSPVGRRTVLGASALERFVHWCGLPLSHLRAFADTLCRPRVSALQAASRRSCAADAPAAAAAAGPRASGASSGMTGVCARAEARAARRSPEIPRPPSLRCGPRRALAARRRAAPRCLARRGLRRQHYGCNATLQRDATYIYTPPHTYILHMLHCSGTLRQPCTHPWARTRPR